MLGSIKNIHFSKDFWESIFKQMPKAYTHKLKLNRRILEIVNGLEKKYSLKHTILCGDLSRLKLMIKPSQIVEQTKESMYIGHTNMGRIEEYFGLYKTANIQHIIYGACEAGNLDLVLKLEKLGVKINNSILTYACTSNNYELVNYILQKDKLNANAGLHNACKTGNIKIVNLLLRHGANNFDMGFNGAFEGGHLNIAKYMAGLGGKNLYSGIEAAFRGAHQHIIEYLIQENNNLEVRKISWNMALYGACQAGNLEMAQLAVARGANNWLMGFGSACKSAN